MARQFAVIPFRALQDPRLQPSDKLILAALGGHTDTSGRCWPSVETIATLSGLQERSVFRSLKRLSETGYLQMEPRAGRSTKYRVLFDTPDIMSPLTGESPTPDIMSPTPDTRVTHNEYKNEDKDEAGVPPAVLVAGNQYFNNHQTRASRLGLLRGMLQGMTDRAVPEAVMVRALEDMVIAGEEKAPFTRNVVKGFVRKAEEKLQGEAARRLAEESIAALRQPDANQSPSAWFDEDEAGNPRAD